MRISSLDFEDSNDVITQYNYYAYLALVKSTTYPPYELLCNLITNIFSLTDSLRVESSANDNNNCINRQGYVNQ